jgi:hypothetical protein
LRMVCPSTLITLLIPKHFLVLRLSRHRQANFPRTVVMVVMAINSSKDIQAENGKNGFLSLFSFQPFTRCVQRLQKK